MTAPTEEVPVPASVERLAAGGRVTPVWVNERGGVTFRVDDCDNDGDDDGARYVKWNPASTGLSLAGEAVRLRWAARWTPVPRVLDHRRDDDGAELLVTAALDGLSAVDPRWLREPATAARSLGEGLRALHDALPVAGCPFDWGIDERLTHLDPEADTDVRAALADRPDVDHLVVCHADACAPNTLLDADGRWTAHVDLGRLGVADPWADLAVCAMSTGWNYGPGYEHLVYEGYGVEPDAARIAYYQLLWDNT
ncbi:aminoglycoside 3'-phosphotransferase [Xylanimonas protaetiae]|uniref:Aminoglycoside 3'-phosphotransferase n=1 Tax=Xylanimonas protaetiae TaxID=2509457 RepID=A0A4P6FDL8_9MICO|nr:aminoglycoside 3'-phosphotransferase [Xylanimonas protaetiae]QAY68678.1 aminoglycoside 3'-phosphotransferase [Xylanimonas protaetiae]